MDVDDDLLDELSNELYSFLGSAAERRRRRAARPSIL